MYLARSVDSLEDANCFGLSLVLESTTGGDMARQVDQSIHTLEVLQAHCYWGH